jgi:hypothetical protein
MSLIAQHRGAIGNALPRDYGACFPTSLRRASTACALSAISFWLMQKFYDLYHGQHHTKPRIYLVPNSIGLFLRDNIFPISLLE